MDHGLRSFYRGSVAEAVITASRKGGGFISEEDLAFYRAEVVDPVESDWHGIRILTVPPPSSGGVALMEELNLFEITGALNQPPGSAVAIHLMSQCIQQAYADADYYVDDIAKADGWRQIITPGHAKEASAGITAKARAGSRKPVSIAPNKNALGNTTHLVVVDKWGNAVSLT